MLVLLVWLALLLLAGLSLVHREALCVVGEAVGEWGPAGRGRMSVADRSSQGNLSVLTGLESVAPLEEVDPSLAEGHSVLYDREVPFEMRAEGAGMEGGAGRELVGSMEGIKVKILTLGDEFALQQIRVELSSENDLFFHFTHALEEASYVSVQAQQKLMASFNEYPNIMIKMLNACIKDSASHLAVFIMHQDGSARLDFIQNMEYKFVELLSCHFIPSPEDIIRRHITYRYSALKHRNHLLQQRLQVPLSPSSSRHLLFGLALHLRFIGIPL